MTREFVPLSEQNIERFASLYVAVFNAPPWRDGWSLPVASERLRSFAQDPHFHGLGLLQANEPVGLVLGAAERWTNGWILHLKEMCVATELQGGGVGRELHAQFERMLKQSSFIGVHLQTGLNAPARHFYERLGYEQYGNVPLRKRLQA
jgi:GNAT superfamily N-acetyltransferase